MHSDNKSKDPLIQNFLDHRSEESFNAIYLKYNRAIYRIAISLAGGSVDDAQDAVQETWIVAIRKIGEFRGASSFKTWLTGILINKCREMSQRHITGDDSFPATGRTENGHQELSTISMDIKAALKNLAGGYREVLILHDVEGYKHHEIAAILGINEGTSKSQLFNARRIVRDFLK